MAVTIDRLPVYQALVGDEETGMIRISLVDSPAVMSDFLAFGKDRKTVMYRVEDEERRIVRGVVMRADFPIYRRDERIGEYYIIYKADTIRTMAEKYLLESRQNNVNLMHEDNSDVDGVQMVQYFIKDSGAGMSPAGFEDIADGSLFAEFHVVNDGIWEEVKSGTYRGFSLEGVFDLVPETDVRFVEAVVRNTQGKFNSNNDNAMATKFGKIREALAKALAAVEQEFGNVTTDKGILVWDGDEDLKAGFTVSVEDSEGNSTSAPDGDYRTRDGKVIRVASGKVSEIVDDKAEVSESEQKNRKDRFEKMRAAFSMSYGDKTRKIAEVLSKQTPDFYIAEAGDDFVVACEFDREYNCRFMRYSVSWSGDVPSIGDGQEVRLAYVPVGMDIVFSSEMETVRTQNESLSRQVNEISAERDTLRQENTALREEVERLRKTPQGKPAHEEFSGGGNVGKTGVRGLDNLARIMGA